jgi:hypothetical protein
MLKRTAQADKSDADVDHRIEPPAAQLSISTGRPKVKVRDESPAARSRVARVKQARKLADDGKAVGAYEYRGQWLTLLARLLLVTEAEADRDDRKAVRRAATTLIAAITDGEIVVNALATDHCGGVHDGPHGQTLTVTIRCRLHVPA